MSRQELAERKRLRRAERGPGFSAYGERNVTDEARERRARWRKAPRASFLRRARAALSKMAAHRAGGPLAAMGHHYEAPSHAPRIRRPRARSRRGRTRGGVGGPVR